jgi:hypothetical protein
MRENWISSYGLNIFAPLTKGSETDKSDLKLSVACSLLYLDYTDQFFAFAGNGIIIGMSTCITAKKIFSLLLAGSRSRTSTGCHLSGLAVISNIFLTETQ